ncbi:sex peptide receptor-like [Planococcus citri]|uniref:sex peptide receptor-like n=1 Tax=Planococcus citri TaxID=170843 RepID=UPI0031FA1214
MYSKKNLFNEETSCGETMILFNTYFVEYIFYAYATWSSIGVTLNMFNIIVFTRKSMISPNNLIYAHLAFVDLASIIAYVPRAWQELVRQRMYCFKEHRVYEWEIASFCSLFTVAILHQISTWITILLAIWRYIAIAHPLKEREWCNMKNTKIFIIAAYAVGFLAALPHVFEVHVAAIDTLLDSDGYPTSNRTIGVLTKVYKIHLWEISKTSGFLAAIFYGIVSRIAAVIVLSVYTYKLIAALKCRQRLTSSMYGSNATITSKKPSTDRTTKILLIIVALCYTCEIPHAICFLVSAIYGIKFIDGCYVYLFGIFTLLVGICISLNFVVYYAMSRQFRNTFHALFSCESSSAREKPVLTRIQRITTITSTHL